MAKQTLANQKLMLADLIEKGRSMVSREELARLVPCLLLYCELDQCVFKRPKLFVYYFGFALVAKLGGVEPTKKYLLRLFSEKKLRAYKTIGISKVLAQAVHEEFADLRHRKKIGIVAWLRSSPRKDVDNLCAI